MFRKYLPAAEFTNTLPPFCEPEGPPVAESDQVVRPETVNSSIGEAGASDTTENLLRLDAGVFTREATAYVEEALAAISSSPSSSEVLQ